MPDTSVCRVLAQCELGTGNSIAWHGQSEAMAVGWPEDAARHGGWGPETLERDLVVHEVGHAVSWIGSHPVTRWDQGVPSRYTEEYLRGIRVSKKPLG